MLKTLLSKLFNSPAKNHYINTNLENARPTGKKTLITTPEIDGESEFEVAEIYVENGARAAKGKVICSLDSKSFSFELESFEKSIIRWKCKKGDIVKSGDKIVEIEIIE